MWRKGHIKPKCRNKDKWASYAAEMKEKVDANLALTELPLAANNELFLVSLIKEDTVITVNVAAEKEPAAYWMLDTGATNHVTGNRDLFESFYRMVNGEHQVQTANNHLVDAKGSGTI
jgi:hypothetical protein